MGSFMVISLSFFKKNFFLPLLVVFISFSFCKVATSPLPDIKSGSMDLSAWEPKQTVINLKGDWEFCWDELIPPESDESVWKKNAMVIFRFPLFGNSTK